MRNIEKWALIIVLIFGLTYAPVAKASWFSEAWDDVVDGITQVGAFIAGSIVLIVENAPIGLGSLIGQGLGYSTTDDANFIYCFLKYINSQFL